MREEIKERLEEMEDDAQQLSSLSLESEELSEETKNEYYGS